VGRDGSGEDEFSRRLRVDRVRSDRGQSRRGDRKRGEDCSSPLLYVYGR
jgi:hypothetical protein